jgi:tripartite-type tricarboxylate transporter receptor subunit TctC
LGAAKAAPKALNFGTPGVGSTPHLAAELLLSNSGTSMTHIPFKGNTEAITELVAGRLDAVFSGVPSVLPLVKSGKLQLLAVTGPERSNLLPQVPSVTEAGYAGAQLRVWYGLLAPAQTPAPIIEKLHRAVVNALKQAGMGEKFTELGLEPAPNTPDEFRDLIRQDGERLGNLIRSMGLMAN